MNLDKARHKMGKTVAALRQQLLGVRGSQLSPNLIASIKVDSNGRPTQIGHLASIVRSKTNISVTLYNGDKHLLSRVEKALAGSGLNAYIFSKDTICVSVEKYGQRRDVEQHIKKAGEEAKIAIRNIRKAVRQKNKQNLSKIDKPLEKMTCGFVKEIVEFVKLKINSI